MKGIRPEAEISLLALVRLLKKNLGTLFLLALVLSTVGVGLVLLLPREYQKGVTLSVTPVASPSLGRFERDGSDGLDLEVLRPDEVGQLAVAHLRDQKLPGIQMSPRYDKNAQQIEVSLTAQNRGALKGAVPGLVELTRGGFQGFNEEALGAALESQRVEVARAAEVNERVVARLDEEIEAIPTSETARLQALENSRVGLLTEIAEAEIRLQDLEEARKELPRLATELVSVEVVNESGVSRARSTLVLIALAVVAGSVAAALLTLALARLKKT